MKTEFFLKHSDIASFKNALALSGGYHVKNPHDMGNGISMVYLAFDTMNGYTTFINEYEKRAITITEVKTNKFKRLIRKIKKFVGRSRT